MAWVAKSVHPLLERTRRVNSAGGIQMGTARPLKQASVYACIGAAFAPALALLPALYLLRRTQSRRSSS